MENGRIRNLDALNMDILSFEKVSLGAWWKAENVCSPYTRVYMVTKGVGYIKIKDETIEMNKGNIYIIPAGCTFSYSCLDGFEKIFFHVTVLKQNAADVFEGADKCYCFNDENGVNLINECYDTNSVFKVMKIKTFLYSVLCRCVLKENDSPMLLCSDFTLKIIEYINQNLSNELTTEKIAEHFFVSPSKIRNLFLKEMGITIGKYINNRIMFEAEKLVANDKLSIGEISEKFGFCDQFYFSRCFSGKYNMSPLKYRKIQLR